MSIDPCRIPEIWKLKASQAEEVEDEDIAVRQPMGVKGTDEKITFFYRNIYIFFIQPRICALNKKNFLHLYANAKAESCMMCIM